jgi:hypothetical protein
MYKLNAQNKTKDERKSEDKPGILGVSCIDVASE